MGIRQIFFVTLPFAALFAVLALPTVRLVYEHGAVRGNEIALAGMASALTFYSVGMAFVSVNTLLNRAFYSIRQPWVPLAAGVGNLALNAVLTIFLYKPLGVGGITLATSLVSMFNFFALMFLLGPRIGGVDARRVAWSATRSVIALRASVRGGVRGLVAARPRSGAQSVGADSCRWSWPILPAAWPTVWRPGLWACRELRDVVSVVRRRRTPRRPRS